MVGNSFRSSLVEVGKLCGKYKKLIFEETFGMIIPIVIQLLMDFPILSYIIYTFGNNFEVNIWYLPLLLMVLIITLVSFSMIIGALGQVLFILCFVVGILSMLYSCISASKTHIMVRKHYDAKSLETHFSSILLPLLIARICTGMLYYNSVGQSVITYTIIIIFSCRDAYCLGQVCYLIFFFLSNRLSKLL